MPNTEVKQYKVRRLTAKDVFTFTNILGVVSGEIKENVKDIDLKNADAQILGITILEVVMKHAEDQLYEFLADLVGMTPDEFAKEPFEAPIMIIETLNEQEDLKGFFKKAQGLMKLFSGK